MTKRHVTLYNNLDNPAPAEVLRQELVTTERTQEGVRITRYKLRFTHSDMVDSFFKAFNQLMQKPRMTTSSGYFPSMNQVVQ